MKILTINTRYIGGGGAAYIANMLHHQINTKDEWMSTFLYGRGVEGDENSSKISYPLVEYISALSFRVSSKELNFNKDIEEYIRDCDIVHLHNIHGYYLDYNKLFNLLIKYNKKIVWTLHDMWPLTGRCAYSFGCEKWKDSCGKCNNKESYPRTIFDRSANELSFKRQTIGSIKSDNMIIVTPSVWLADMCRESYLNKYQICSIPNGIEHKRVKLSKEEIRAKYNIPQNRKVILFVAADTNDKRKGINFILEIMNYFPEYTFVSIGKEIKNMVYSNFIQLGYIKDRDKINQIYSMADVFVIPSLDDNFPTTVIESFANGTPVIGFNQGGIPEQLSGECGIIVEEISNKALKMAIKEILDNDLKREMYSQNAFKKFTKNYTLDEFINSYFKLYNRLYDK